MKVSIQEDMWAVARRLPRNQRERLIEALLAYGFDGVEPDAADEPWSYLFDAFKGRIEMSARSSRGGERGSRRRWDGGADDASEDGASDPHDRGASDPHDRGASDPHDGGGETPIEHPHDAESENESEIESEREKEIDRGVDAVIDHLNSVCGTSFRRSAKSTRRIVAARLRDGASVDECNAVIDHKAREWLHDGRMRKYLRPETLFNATKFEAYRNEASCTDPPASSAFAAYDVVPLAVVGGE